MPNKSKKTSKVRVVRKQPQGGGGKGNSGGSTTQKALMAAMNAGAMYAKAGPAGAALSLGTSLYDYLGSKDDFKVRPVRAPASVGSIISGSSRNSFKITPVGENVSRVTGHIMALRITTGPGNTQYAYDTDGNFHQVASTANGSYRIGLRIATTAATVAQYGFPNCFCPYSSALTAYANVYDRWAPEHYSFEWVPACPTTQYGSVTMAWTDIASAAIEATPQVYGGTPFTISKLSQMAAFSNGPVWQGHGFELNPRKHGICENPKDWLTVEGVANSSSVYPLAAGAPGFGQGGTFMIAVENAGSALATAETTLGTVIYRYSYLLHQPGPIKQTNNGYYSPANMIDYAMNADLKEELLKRAHELKLKCGFNTELLRKELFKEDEKEEYFSVPRPLERDSYRPTTVPSRPSTPNPPSGPSVGPPPPRTSR